MEDTHVSLQELGAQTVSSCCVFCKVPFKDMVLRVGRRYEVKVLHCLHSACGRCLEEILTTGQEVLCPVCDHRIKEQDYHKYLCNFAENQTLDYRAAGFTSTPLITCDECVDAGPAVQYCARCVRRLCAECAEHHGRSRASASHVLTELTAMAEAAEAAEAAKAAKAEAKELTEDSQRSSRSSSLSLHRLPLCASHRRELEFFCEDCSMMCCRECIRESHETHVYKLPSGSLVERQRQGLSDNAQQLQSLFSSLQERRRTLSENLHSCEAELAKALQNIRHLEGQVKEALQQRRIQMLDEVKVFRDQQRESHEARRASLASQLLTRWRAIDFLEKVLARGTNCEVLLLTGYISAQRLLGKDVLASKVAELALCAALRPKQIPVKWSGDVAAAAHEISQMAAVSTQGRHAVEASPLQVGESQMEEVSEPTQAAETFESHERQIVSLQDAVPAPPAPAPQPICLSQALEPRQAVTSVGPREKLVHYLKSDQEIRESGLGELRAVLGLEGDALGCFRSPCGMAVDSSRLYVADTLNHRIQIFDKLTLEALGVLRLPSSGDGPSSLSDPSGMCCVEVKGMTILVVVEYTLDRVLRIELGQLPQAAAVRELAPGTFYGPFGAGISQGRVVIADSCNHRCLVLTLNGQILFEFGTRGQGRGQFDYPECLAAFADGHVAVSDKDNHRIQVFDANGSFQHLIPRDWAPESEGHLGPGRLRAGVLRGPMGMCVDARDRLFVCDCGSDRVQIFSRQGDFLWSSCSATWIFRSPTAMAADQHSLYVASDHCVQIF